MKILIVTDAWFPQVNGVVRTLDTIRREVEKLGHVVEMITPDQFRNFPCPTYPEIRLAPFQSSTIARRIDTFAPDAIHISTEGPLGQAARRIACGGTSPSRPPITRGSPNISMPGSACRCR